MIAKLTCLRTIRRSAILLDVTCDRAEIRVRARARARYDARRVARRQLQTVRDSRVRVADDGDRRRVRISGDTLSRASRGTSLHRRTSAFGSSRRSQLSRLGKREWWVPIAWLESAGQHNTGVYKSWISGGGRISAAIVLTRVQCAPSRNVYGQCGPVAHVDDDFVRFCVPDHVISVSAILVYLLYFVCYATSTSVYDARCKRKVDISRVVRHIFQAY